MGKQDRDMGSKLVEKTSFGPGPAAYNPLNSLKAVVDKQKPKFQYYMEEGFHSSVLRQTHAAKTQRIVQEQRDKERDQRKLQLKEAASKAAVTGGANEKLYSINNEKAAANRQSNKPGSRNGPTITELQNSNTVTKDRSASRKRSV